MSAHKAKIMLSQNYDDEEYSANIMINGEMMKMSAEHCNG